MTPEQVADTDPAYLVRLYLKSYTKPCSKTLYLACVDEMTGSDPDF